MTQCDFNTKNLVFAHEFDMIYNFFIEIKGLIALRLSKIKSDEKKFVTRTLSLIKKKFDASKKKNYKYCQIHAQHQIFGVEVTLYHEFGITYDFFSL